LRPRVLRAQAERLARDPLAEEVVPADEDPALAVSVDPVDVEDPGEADDFAGVVDVPEDPVLALGVVLETLLQRFVAEISEPRSPETADLGPEHRARVLLGRIERRRDERDAVPTLDPRPEHQRKDSAGSGSDSRSPPPRACPGGLSLKRGAWSTYPP